jgi:hypothetical protein
VDVGADEHEQPAAGEFPSCLAQPDGQRELETTRAIRSRAGLADSSCRAPCRPREPAASIRPFGRAWARPGYPGGLVRSRLPPVRTRDRASGLLRAAQPDCRERVAASLDFDDERTSGVGPGGRGSSTSGTTCDSIGIG